MLARARASLAALSTRQAAWLAHHALSWTLLMAQILCFRLLDLQAAIAVAMVCWTVHVLAVDWGAGWIADRASSDAYVRGIQELAMAHLRAIEGERARAAEAANTQQVEVIRFDDPPSRDWH